MKIGEKVRELREAQTMTQEELGRRAGMAQASIARFESGKHIPKVATLQKLATALNCKLVISFE